MSFAVIDYIFCLVILVFAIIGVVKGFIDNIFGKLSWILGILGAFFFYDRVSRELLTGIRNVVLSNVVAFIILFVVIFLVIKIIQVILSKVFAGKILGSLDKALGFFFGIVEGLAIVALIIFILCNQTLFPVDGIFNESFFLDIFNQFITGVDFNEVKNYV